MARDRILPSDLWTWEAVVDCAAMTRLLFIGLWNFADDFGIQPLRPRTIRMQVFPGDTIENDSVRAMIDELVARGLVRIYEAEGREYLEIVDWSQFQRVGKRAKRRYPAFPAPHADGQTAPSVSETDAGNPAAANSPDHSKPLQSSSSGPPGSNGSVIPSTARDPGESYGSLAALGMTGEANCLDVAPATPRAWPSALAPPSTPADVPAPRR
ncbi:MAG: hypothetical protein FJX20_14240 [Alphaproteobacteria bacterium]|nr:hypothetical protein [Alphaproteobacteria bacterium]